MSTDRPIKAQYRDQERAQKIPHPGEGAAEVVSEGGEDGVGSVTGTAFGWPTGKVARSAS